MAVKRYNVRMAGLGGQGVVTASHILSNGVVKGVRKLRLSRRDACTSNY